MRLKCNNNNKTEKKKKSKKPTKKKKKRTPNKFKQQQTKQTNRKTAEDWLMQSKSIGLFLSGLDPTITTLSPQFEIY